MPDATLETISDDQGVEAIADLARRAADAQQIDLASEQDHDLRVVARMVRDDEEFDLQDLDELYPEPRHQRGRATLHNPEAFCAYVNRLHSNHTTVWADITPSTGPMITAVLNDHDTEGATGWRDLRATLVPQVDVDWRVWTQHSGNLLPQAAFGEFLQDMLHTIRTPEDVSELVTAATTFTTRKALAFESSTNLTDGSVHFQYTEQVQQQAKRGSAELPAEIVLQLTPFVGVPAQDVVARLRWRATSDGLVAGYKLHRPDRVVLEAIDRMVQEIIADTPAATPVLMGVAPEPLR